MARQIHTWQHWFTKNFQGVTSLVNGFGYHLHEGVISPINKDALVSYPFHQTTTGDINDHKQDTIMHVCKENKIMLADKKTW